MKHNVWTAEEMSPITSSQQHFTHLTVDLLPADIRAIADILPRTPSVLRLRIEGLSCSHCMSTHVHACSPHRHRRCSPVRQVWARCIISLVKALLNTELSAEIDEALLQLAASLAQAPQIDAIALLGRSLAPSVTHALAQAMSQLPRLNRISLPG